MEAISRSYLATSQDSLEESILTLYQASLRLHGILPFTYVGGFTDNEFFM